jgi:diguanylate cyclase (GGDEF)-like protein/PAS domain S-box-containing protein
MLPTKRPIPVSRSALTTAGRTSQGAHPETLLIADDDRINRIVLISRLEARGFQTVVAENGREVLELTSRQRFDLILLDIMMPEMDGLEVLQALRAKHSAADLPVIMVTAKNRDQDVVHALTVGANDYLTKPINFAIAIARINTQLALRRSHEALCRSETRYALAARGANDGLWDWDLVANEIYYSPRWKSMLGYEEIEIGASTDEWFSRIHPEDRARVQASAMAHCEGETPHFENEYRILHKTKGYRWMLSRGLVHHDPDGTPSRMAGSQTDITESKVADALTGLPNRILFMDRLDRALERAKRHPDYRFALLFLDLDRFKIINDSLGHHVGDQLLVAIARRLEACLRSSDSIGRLGEATTVARLGGDEFTILLDDLGSEADVIAVAERILHDLAQSFHVGEQEIFTNVSIGVRMGAADCAGIQELVQDADTAMYCAKSAGRGCFAVFDAAMRENVVNRLRLEMELRQALEQGHFCLHYQPIIALELGCIVGFEALLRWQHPERGLVSPSEIIPIAEETGLIVPLGWWVMREACRQMAAWQARFKPDPPLTIAVNFSSKQLLQPQVAEQIQEVLRETGLDVRCLKLEITESAIIDNTATVVALLDRLRELGIRVAIDDFGTGYSSLSYLHRFSIDTLKIDQSFVRGLDKSQKSGIVSSIIAMAHGLDLDVVAEGVETTEQRARLLSLDCEYGQGFYFSEPVTSATAEAALEASLNRVPSDHGGPFWRFDEFLEKAALETGAKG